MRLRFFHLIGCLCALGVFSCAYGARLASPNPKTDGHNPRRNGVEAKPAAPVAAHPRSKASRIYVIPVRSEINSAVLYVVRRGIKEAMAENADAVILDIKTLGGELGATFEIMEAIAKFPKTTIAYVNTEAMSAGAFISAATNEIWFAPGSVIGAAAPVNSNGQDIDATMKAKILSYLEARVRSMSEGKGYRGEVVTAMMDADFELTIDGKMIKPKGKLLSLTSTEAAKLYGDPPQSLLSAGTAETLDDLVGQRFDGGPAQTRLTLTWSETLATWLNSIAPLLLGLGVLALFIEFKTPGFGIFGIVGIVCLAIVFVSSYVAGLSGHEPVLAFGLGLVLLAVEVFFFPGTILLGITGVILIFGSLVWAMADLWPNEPISVAWSADAFARPLANLGLGLLVAIAGAVVLLRFLPKGWFWDKMVLNSAVAATAQSGTGAVVEDTLPVPDTLIGARGVVVTALRPSGQVDIAGRRYEARVMVGTAPVGQLVVVVRRKDFELIVEEEKS